MESTHDGAGRTAREESSEWRLEEWLDMLTDDAIYQVPSTDAPEGDARNTLYIIADDALHIRSRVKQKIHIPALDG